MRSVKSIFEQEAKAIMNIPTDGFYEKVVDLIYQRVHKLSGKVVTSGMGKAGQIALNMATTLSSTGTPAVFLHPSEAQHGDLGVLQPNDVIIAISNSGKTREIVELIDLKSRLHNSIPVIVITSNIDSGLALEADIIIPTGNPEEVCTLGLTPTTSTTVMTVIGDAIVVLLEEKIGFTHEEYAKRHHGGYLGIKARANSNI